MLKTEAHNLVREAKDLMEVCVKQMTVGSLKTMSADELAMIQKCIKLMDAACEVTITQAMMLDDMNDKLDKVLHILEKAEEGS